MVCPAGRPEHARQSFKNVSGTTWRRCPRAPVAVRCELPHDLSRILCYAPARVSPRDGKITCHGPQGRLEGPHILSARAGVSPFSPRLRSGCVVTSYRVPIAARPARRNAHRGRPQPAGRPSSEGCTGFEASVQAENNLHRPLPRLLGAGRFAGKVHIGNH